MPTVRDASRAFQPQFMNVGILTAAFQELTPRAVRDGDSDRAIEDWIQFGAEFGVETIQISAALNPNETDIPPEAMLDPVTNTLDLRQPFDAERARRVRRALDSAHITILTSVISTTCCTLDIARTPLIVEHEYPKARTQDRERLKPILQGSIAFIRHIDRAAACMYALQHDVLPSQSIPVQGRGREPYRS